MRKSKSFAYFSHIIFRALLSFLASFKGTDGGHNSAETVGNYRFFLTDEQDLEGNACVRGAKKKKKKKKKMLSSQLV